MKNVLGKKGKRNKKKLTLTFIKKQWKIDYIFDSLKHFENEKKDRVSDIDWFEDQNIRICDKVWKIMI